VLASVAIPTKGSLFVNGAISTTPNTGLSFGVGAGQHHELGATYRTLVQQIAWGAPLAISAGQHLFRGYSRGAQTLIGINNGATAISSTQAPNAVTGGVLSVGGHVAASYDRYFIGSIKAVVLYNYDTIEANQDAAIRAYLLGL
jgi:hypothetical protein